MNTCILSAQSTSEAFLEFAYVAARVPDAYSFVILRTNILSETKKESGRFRASPSLAQPHLLIISQESVSRLF